MKVPVDEVLVSTRLLDGGVLRRRACGSYWRLVPGDSACPSCGRGIHHSAPASEAEYRESRRDQPTLEAEMRNFDDAGTTGQPAPTAADDRETWPLVVEDATALLPATPARDRLRADMRARDRLGRDRYGTALAPHNGRDSLVDAYQEALDLAVYLKNALVELDDEGRRLDSMRGAVEEEYHAAVRIAYRIRVLLGSS